MKTYCHHLLFIVLLILICQLKHSGTTGKGELKKDQTFGKKESILFSDEEIVKNECTERSRTKRSSDEVTLPDDYNKLQIPIFKIQTNDSEILKKFEDIDIFEITVGVLIRKIREIDELEEEVTVEIDFSATWIDWLIFTSNAKLFTNDNLTVESIEKSLQTLDPSFLNQIWKPDLFIENVESISRPELISKPVKLMISQLGAIIYSARVTVKLDCDMEFHYYPADTQECIFNIRSYSHTVKELSIQWKQPAGVYILDRSDTSFDVHISRVTILNITEFRGLLHQNYSETYNILQFTLSARRKMNFHLIQTYVPSLFFIGITWLCFLVPPALVEARIGVAMTTLLTLTSMFSSVRESSPVVSYVKAIDIWMVSCIFFVFLTLFEFTLLIWLRHEQNLDNPNNDSALVPLEEPTINEGLSTVTRTSFTKNLRERHQKRKSRYLTKKFQNTAVIIEEYAFLTLFLTFMIFNIIYWPWMLLASGYFNWKIDYTYNSKDEQE